MQQKEIDRAIHHFRLEYQIKNDIQPIAKDELIVGQKYLGLCRNSNVAVWNGKCFEYERYKFGSTFIESINHFEDDNGYDVFIPFMKFDL